MCLNVLQIMHSLWVSRRILWSVSHKDYHATKHWIVCSSRLDLDKLGEWADLLSISSLLNLVRAFHKLSTERERQSLDNSSQVVCAVYFFPISYRFQSVVTVLQPVRKGKQSLAILWFKRGSLCWLAYVFRDYCKGLSKPFLQQLSRLSVFQGRIHD